MYGRVIKSATSLCLSTYYATMLSKLLDLSERKENKTSILFITVLSCIIEQNVTTASHMVLITLSLQSHLHAVSNSSLNRSKSDKSRVKQS